MLPGLNDIELSGDSPMPAPTNRRDDYYVTVPVELQWDGKPTLNLKHGKIGVSSGTDNQDEMLLQFVQVGSNDQTPCADRIIGVTYLNKRNAARLAAAILYWVAAEHG